MSRRTPSLVLLGALLLSVTTACTNKKVNNPLANIGSKQPDKVLFDKAMDKMKHNQFDQARMVLQVLINTYPDSEFIARAKLALGDSWYSEGGTTALTQAELEYKDFITFFPNMPEAAEAQLKIANIHYQQMEKPDRDFTHAMRAEDEYRQLIIQFPDSKLVPEAKQRLLEVQEVLAQREFGIGRFYYLRGSYAASIARLRSLGDRYPLYSRADEALYLLGQNYEAQIANIRAASKVPETSKAKMIQQFTKDASDAYSRIITRYPVMDRADDARKRLQALHQPVPKPTKAAVAQNQKEEDSRRGQGIFGHLMGGFTRHPDVAQATKVGEPTLVDPQPVSATQVVQEASHALVGNPGVGDNKVSVETVKPGAAPPANEEAPRSDAPGADAKPVPAGKDSKNAAPVTTENPITPSQVDDSQGSEPPAAARGIGELKPDVANDNGQPVPPPPQVNEIQPGSQPAADSNQGTNSASDSSSSSSKQQKDEDENYSSSKKRKKKHRLFPF